MKEVTKVETDYAEYCPTSKSISPYGEDSFVFEHSFVIIDLYFDNQNNSKTHKMCWYLNKN